MSGQVVVIVGECRDYEDRETWIVAALPGDRARDAVAWKDRANALVASASFSGFRLYDPKSRNRSEILAELSRSTGDPFLVDRSIAGFSGVPEYRVETPRTSLPAGSRSSEK